MTPQVRPLGEIDLTINDDGTYTLNKAIVYRSHRYNKIVTCPENMPTDGATGAIDITSRGWIVHDQLCKRGTWDDGTLISNWQCSQVLQDILQEEGRQFRAFGWFWATWLFGGGQARKNGMLRVKKAAAIESAEEGAA